MAQETSVQEVETPEALASRVIAIIDRIKANPFDHRFKSTEGSYLFDVTDVGTWRVDITQGEIKVTDGGDEADCIIRTEADKFLRVASGEMNLLAASMRGEVELDGDMALAQKMNGLMPAPKMETKATKGKGGAK